MSPPPSSLSADTIARRETAAAIARAAVDAVDPAALVRARCRREGTALYITTPENQEITIDLTPYTRILVCAIGKAAGAMASEMVKICGGSITSILVIAKNPDRAALSAQLHALAPALARSDIEIIGAGHPIPDDASIRAGQQLHALARSADAKTLLLTCISGGASALVTLPRAHADTPLTLGDIQELTAALMRTQASINEINVIRKHCSLIKGGQLVRTAHPARCVNLVMSDVIGDDLASIASGPTVPDTSTFADAVAILQHYELWEHTTPPGIRRLFTAGAAGKVPETPKPGAAEFAHSDTLIIGNNTTALHAAAATASGHGYQVHIISDALIGEARQAGVFIAGTAHYWQHHGAGERHCLLFGGETTVTIRGTGRGGRNQELALAFCQHLGAGGILAPAAHSGHPHTPPPLLLSVATDGNDGPTDAAGAFADTAALESARAQGGLDIAAYLADNNSYEFHQQAGSLYVTGLTGTNVCDIQIVLVN